MIKCQRCLQAIISHKFCVDHYALDRQCWYAVLWENVRVSERARSHQRTVVCCWSCIAIPGMPNARCSRFAHFWDEFFGPYLDLRCNCSHVQGVEIEFHYRKYSHILKFSFNFFFLFCSRFSFLLLVLWIWSIAIKPNPIRMRLKWKKRRKKNTEYDSIVVSKPTWNFHATNQKT